MKCTPSCVGGMRTQLALPARPTNRCLAPSPLPALAHTGGPVTGAALISAAQLQQCQQRPALQPTSTGWRANPQHRPQQPEELAGRGGRWALRLAVRHAAWQPSATSRACAAGAAAGAAARVRHLLTFQPVGACVALRRGGGSSCSLGCHEPCACRGAEPRGRPAHDALLWRQRGICCAAPGAMSLELTRLACFFT